MATFYQREAALEAAFVHGEDERFKALARATRDLARWAAGEIGEDAGSAERYADEILAMRLEDGGGPRIVARIAHDLARAGLAVSDATVAEKADSLLRTALDAAGR